MSKDLKFLQSAFALAQIWSKDPSSKVAAVAVGDTPNLVAWGYNGFPPGIADTENRLFNREVKYSLVLHAEENALANATFPVRTLYVTHPPCQGCALRILGYRSVLRVVCAKPSPEFQDRWHASIKQTLALFEEAGVKYEEIDVWNSLPWTQQSPVP